MPRLTLVRGIPGSGKTTLAKQIAAETGAEHFEADMYFICPRTGDYIFEGDKVRDAHEWCINKTKEALSKGKNVVVANTFVKRWEVEKYFDLCDRSEIRIITASGEYNNQHGVPPETVKRMKENFEHI